jgi:hypothetical protein
MSRVMESVRDYANQAKDYAREHVGNMTKGSSHREGGLAKPIEEYTAALPSDTWLWLGYGSIAASLALRAMGRKHDAIFVGMWAPVFLIHGVYNKLVKQLGHDKYDRDRD